MARYLTKTRFKIAMECPTKLYYTGKAQYANLKNNDTFLQALAEGGYQVGELAKAYFPGGIDIGVLDYDEAVRQTSDLLTMDRVIIFEAAFRSASFFIRADIVIKDMNHLDLIEVKSKSNNSQGIQGMMSKSGQIKSSWRPYIEDVAFQKYVVSLARPEFTVTASLMTVDKDACCPSDGLNQKFRIVRDSEGRKIVVLNSALTQAEANHRILRQDNVD